MSSYAHLLSPGRIGTLELRNRIIMSPMGDDLCHEDGTVSDQQLAYAEARARGGVACVMLGSVAVGWPTGTSNQCQTGISDDRFIPGLTRLADAVHAHGARIALQLTHAGKVGMNDIRAGRPMLVPSRPRPAGRTFDPLYAQVTDAEAAAMSAPTTDAGAKVDYAVMTADDIAMVTEWFASAAERAQRAGIDAVELHGGHGYLIDEFLSPTTNFRTDAYGGTVENRSRFLVECVQAIRRRVGRDYPVWVRLNAHEFFTDGTTVVDAVATASLAEAAGVDAIHVSAYADPGRTIGFTEAHTTHTPGYFIDYARAIKQRVAVPVIAVGRIEPDVAEQCIAAGDFDFVAMGRKLLADPELPNKLAEARPDDIRPCMYHYRCIGQIFVREGVRCAVNPATARERELALTPAAVRRRVLVVGGGPAGMEAARLAAARGHDVVLCESSDGLGGRLRYAAQTYAPNADVLRWLTGQVAKSAVEVRLGTTVDPGLVRSLGAEAVIVATGGQWLPPVIAGAERSNVFTVDEARPWLLDGAPLDGEHVVVLGGGRAGLGLADLASSRGHRVTVLETGRVFAPQLGLPGRWRLIHELQERDVALFGSVAADSIEIGDGNVRFSVGGESLHASADVVLVASRVEPNRGLLDELGAAGVAVHPVGDCTGAGYIEGAMLDAATVAVSL